MRRRDGVRPARALRRAGALAGCLAGAAAGVAGLALPVVAPAEAQAQDATGGSQPAQPGEPPSSGSRPAAPPPVLRPVVEGVTCRTACAGIVRATPGSVVRVTGDGVERAAHLVFLGRPGPRDDAVAVATAIGPGVAQAIVPRRARTGALRVVAADRSRSRPSRRRLLVGRRTAVAGAALESRSDTRRVFLDGTRRASVSFYVRRSLPVAVDVVRAGDGAVVAHWDVPAPPAGTVHTVAWDGRAGGVPAPEGRYVWRVVPAATGQPRAAQAGAPPAPAAAPAGPSFLLLSHRFPVAGPHTYGDGLGADRGHEGVDVFAACGTPLVAAVGGTVRHVAFHERAGNYVVITGTDGVDHVYMHLKDPTPLAKGQAVATGQVVGAVGDTGRATGCHLHFEMWSAPGWYSGGSLLDPMPHLRAWDASA